MLIRDNFFKSSETGVIECEISLPCSHRVGSACIATWLRTNNTCPVCRRVFFPAQPRPYLEGDVLEDDGVDSMDDEPLETDGWPRLSENTIFLCHRFREDLGLSLNALNIALQMAEYFDSSMDFDYSPLVTVSTTLYMASHMMNEHRSPLEIFYSSGIETQSIRRAYSRIYPIRETLIRPQMLGSLSVGNLQDFVNSLPSPDTEDRLDTENRLIDHGRDGCELAHPEQLEELCNQYSDELAHVGGVRDICPQIAGKVQAGLYLTGPSPLPVVAVSLYIASQLVNFGTTIKQISEVVGVSEGTIRDAYRSVYPWRGEFIDSDILDMHEDIHRYRVLRAIAWPPVEGYFFDGSG